ncbi:MAG: type II toxin-antitoxin system VapC family toxin [Verrucomicrobiota bacterium]|jgi:predicted nucleic acid-binding protein
MYLDSAIIVKLLVRESDSQWFDRALAGHSFETSELALTEVRSALLAKERNGQITSPERVAATGKLHSMVEAGIIELLALNRAVLERASQIQLACHPGIPLRTLDALHVATCELHRSGTMCATDGRMRAACDHFAIALLPARMEEIAADSPK